MKYLTKEGVAYVCEELLSRKRYLETCSPEVLKELQTEIKVFRALLERENVEEPEEEIEF